MFETFWIRLNFSLGLIIMIAVLCRQLPKRKLFALRAVFALAAIFTVSAFWGDATGYPTIVIMWLTVVKFFVQFILVCLGTFFCIKTNVWSYIFIGVAAYCLQHISYQSYSIIVELINVAVPLYGRIILLLGIYAGMAVCAHFLLVKKRMRYGNEIVINNKFQIPLALSILSLTICISFFGAVYSMRVPFDGPNILLIIICLFSIISSFIGLALEFGLFEMHKKDAELNTVKSLLYAEREHYKITKETIDLINRKSHDLKHQISAFEGKLAIEEYREIEGAIRAYDSSFHTGSAALDVVLAEKSLRCAVKGINLTCLADGSALSTLAEHDVYSLFGNALENAIESVEKLQEDLRVISVTEERRSGFAIYRFENYFSGELSFEDGLPRTTHKNKLYHGFGMKSMRLLCEKYGGFLSVRTEGDMFMLDIMLPLTEAEVGVEKSSA